MKNKNPNENDFPGGSPSDGRPENAVAFEPSQILALIGYSAVGSIMMTAGLAALCEQIKTLLESDKIPEGHPLRSEIKAIRGILGHLGKVANRSVSHHEAIDSAICRALAGRGIPAASHVPKLIKDLPDEGRDALAAWIDREPAFGFFLITEGDLRDPDLPGSGSKGKEAPGSGETGSGSPPIPPGSRFNPPGWNPDGTRQN